MTIRQASIADLGAVMAIVREVVEEMQTVGNYQWDGTYPDDARFIRDIENEALYVAEENGDVIAFVTVDRDEPEEYRGLSWSESAAFLVIHRFAVARRSRNLGVASTMETFICRLAREHGIDLLKVDTYSTNAGMQEFLSARGYREVGEMTYRGKPLPFYCYEKRVGTHPVE